jgi:hypothetical protein
MENVLHLRKMFFLYIFLSGMHERVNGMRPPSRTAINGRFMGYLIWRGNRLSMPIDLDSPTFF